MAFAVDMPNIDPANDTVVNPQDWRDCIISVRELENRLNANGTQFDFLSNLPQTLQDAIETRGRDDIRAWVDGLFPTAPLVAAEDLPSQLEVVTTDTAIRHNGLVKDDTFVEVNFFSLLK